MEVDLPQTRRIASYLGNRANRARLLGARVEMCAFLVARAPSPTLLIVKSQWGPWGRQALTRWPLGFGPARFTVVMYTGRDGVDAWMT